MKTYRVTHTTRYRYSMPVSLCHNEAHLVPRDDRHQRSRLTQLQIDPSPAVRDAREDFFGNRVIYFAIQHPHTVLRVTAVSEVTVESAAVSPEVPSPAWDEAVRTLATMPEARPFVVGSRMVPIKPDWARYARPSFEPGRPLLEAVHDLMRRIYTDFKYHPGFTTVSTPLETVLEHRRGVCQDFAHLGIACLRSLGLAARYVSGYMRTIPPPGQPRLVGADASHAWFAALVPGVGWVDYDPTNNTQPATDHVTLAWGRDYSDVPPLKGVILGGGPHTLEVSVDVLPLDEEKPAKAVELPPPPVKAGKKSNGKGSETKDE